jgi:hypothetical protein
MVYFDVKSDLRLFLNRDHRLAIAGTKRNPAGAQIIELRGWLRQHDPDKKPNRTEEPDPNDWRYDLEIDPSWTDQKGINLNDVMRVGSILLHKTTDESMAAVSPPKVHVELMAWRPGQTIDQGFLTPRRSVPDPHWTFEDIWAPPPGTVWAWDPRCPSNDGNVRLTSLERDQETDTQHADYVLIEGALITDDPHWDDTRWGPGSKAWGERFWEYGANPKEHPRNPSRWTEIHPPDRIEILPYKAPVETVRCAAVVAPSGYNWADERSLSFVIDTVGPRPDPEATLECIELVGPETNVRTISEGNADHTGALIGKVIDSNGFGHVHVHVKVRGEGGFRPVYGQFKAIYRVYWQLPPRRLRLGLNPPPSAITAGIPTPVTVRAEDEGGRGLVGGTVHIDNDPRDFGTNTPFDYTFHGARHRMRVGAPGYPDTGMAFDVRLGTLLVHVSQYPVPLERPVQLVVHAKDERDGRPIDGRVLIRNPGRRPSDPPMPPDGFPTNQIFEVVLRSRMIRRRDPDGGWTVDVENPTGIVAAPDYSETSIDFGFPE